MNNFIRDEHQSTFLSLYWLTVKLAEFRRAFSFTYLHHFRAFGEQDKRHISFNRPAQCRFAGFFIHNTDYTELLWIQLMRVGTKSSQQMWWSLPDFECMTGFAVKKAKIRSRGKDFRGVFQDFSSNFTCLLLTEFGFSTKVDSLPWSNESVQIILQPG